MTPVETALIILVIIWSIIFVVFGVGIFIILLGVKKALDRINNILSDAEDLTRGVSAPLRAAASTLMGLVGRSKGSIKKR